MEIEKKYRFAPIWEAETKRTVASTNGHCPIRIFDLKNSIREDKGSE